MFLFIVNDTSCCSDGLKRTRPSGCRTWLEMWSDLKWNCAKLTSWTEFSHFDQKHIRECLLMFQHWLRSSFFFPHRLRPFWSTARAIFEMSWNKCLMGESRHGYWQAEGFKRIHWHPLTVQPAARTTLLSELVSYFKGWMWIKGGFPQTTAWMFFIVGPKSG